MQTVRCRTAHSAVRVANGLIPKSGPVTAIECLHSTLRLPTSVVITGCDSLEILDQAVTAARIFRPLSEAQVRALLEKTTEAGTRGKFELFKTTSLFDATAANPEWLGEEPQHVRNMMVA